MRVNIFIHICKDHSETAYTTQRLKKYVDSGLDRDRKEYQNDLFDLR